MNALAQQSKADSYKRNHSSLKAEMSYEHLEVSMILVKYYTGSKRKLVHFANNQLLSPVHLSFFKLLGENLCILTKMVITFVLKHALKYRVS